MLQLSFFHGFAIVLMESMTGTHHEVNQARTPDSEM
jgi:hypothetical protein